jgi:hypothetical protein
MKKRKLLAIDVIADNETMGKASSNPFFPSLVSPFELDTIHNASSNSSNNG